MKKLGMGMGVVFWALLMFVFSVVSVVGMWVIWGRMVCVEVKVVGVSAEMLDVLMVLDVVSLSFMSLVFFISSCVLFYSVSYMGSDEMSSRLVGLMVVFVFSMVLLILFPSLLGLILGWDGLGLSSFLLVVFYQNDNALASGMITALSNRIGDGLLITSMGMCLGSGHWNSFFEMSWLVGVFVGLASITKSAQVPLRAWLPAAMAAPTPVSSLVHSSTLVTAGVYLLLRYGVVAEMADILLVLSSMTLILGGVSALFEGDVKKVVALSTLSQLGMMVFVVSLGFKVFCLFHLYMHALLKASLFLAVGAIIHARNEQDINFLSGSILDSPGSSAVVVVSCGALSGIPFLCGWFSKDVILEVLLGGVSWVYSFILFLGVVSSVIYSGRLVWMCVFSPVGFAPMNQSADCKVMLASMWLLLLGVVFGGPFFYYWLGVESVVVVNEFDKFVGLVIIGFGCLFVFNWFTQRVKYVNWKESKKEFFCSQLWLDFCKMMWFLPLLSGEVGIGMLKLGNASFVYLEQGWMEFFGGKGAKEIWGVFFSLHQRMQMGGMNLTLTVMSLSFFVIVVGVGVNYC
uniref:NADH-ubiquinone oxidoreductase chain 5 n=1 Tax=Tegillarca granosa TaxID=220873 RepID=A0A0A7CJY1_TEGGR|nr:NADH dehydrogenase subunit 5 [Tegillarca granosa]AID49101.1 NADH dehydrogenase subunit 5 [Tegillarca granosa]